MAVFVFCRRTWLTRCCRWPCSSSTWLTRCCRWPCSSSPATLDKSPDGKGSFCRRDAQEQCDTHKGPPPCRRTAAAVSRHRSCRSQRTCTKSQKKVAEDKAMGVDTKEDADVPQRKGCDSRMSRQVFGRCESSRCAERGHGTKKMLYAIRSRRSESRFPSCYGHGRTPRRVTRTSTHKEGVCRKVKF
jgi:hypothetical protein